MRATQRASIPAADLLLGGWRRAGHGLRFEEEGADQALLLRQRRERLRRQAMLEAQRRHPSAEAATEARVHVRRLRTMLRWCGMSLRDQGVARSADRGRRRR